ncbi:MAG: amino acid adenylation domain-containing protein [Tissierellaceae bacterium]|jgi:D-alanine--poly(phosphoribitol) ligase subunit 1
MQYNVLEYLEHTVNRLPEKVAYADDKIEITFQETYNQARAIGTFLARRGIYKEPVAVFMNKSPMEIVAFFGVVYGGNFYVPLDEEMPKFRIELILENIKPKAIICDESSEMLLKEMGYGDNLFLYDSIVGTSIDKQALEDIRNKAIDTDPLYVVFTSGSTGIPKGVVACHRSVIDYIENLTQILDCDEDTVFGNQVPLYFDACLKEVYSTIKCGATTYIIPKSHFMFPLKLVEFLNEYKINTVCWVVSALTIISSFKVLDKIKPEYLHTIAFGSEVFPIKQFNLWREALPDARFINLYGPTEATGMSCYYEVDREFDEDDVIPIGRPFKNTDIILLDENDKIPEQGELGEICIRGTSLTFGYYNAFDITNKVFVQNPLNTAYPELIYRTGDLGRYNQYGELEFVSRKDYQIKHMGHRIELGEIEANVNKLDEIKSSCCIYDEEGNKIVLFYVGDINIKDLSKKLRQSLPRYMVPNKIQQLEVMPLTPNGKLDRVYLKGLIKSKNKER